MERQPQLEQVQRLTVKTLDQEFVIRALESLGCSKFEAGVLTELIKNVCFPWLCQPESIQSGQLAMIAVSASRLMSQATSHSPGARWRR